LFWLGWWELEGGVAWHGMAWYKVLLQGRENGYSAWGNGEMELGGGSWIAEMRMAELIAGV